MPVISHKTVQHNRVFTVAIRLVLHEDGWLVLGLRGHGWLHGDRQSALADAAWLAANLGMRIREVAA
jgi:hypothetical protein